MEPLSVRTCACCVPHIEKQVCVEEDWNEFFLRSRSSDRSSKESVNKYGISCVWIQIAQDALLLDTLTF